MDCVRLLKKYLYAVSVSEGDAFALNPNGPFTDEELAELKRLLDKANVENGVVSDKQSQDSK